MCRAAALLALLIVSPVSLAAQGWLVPPRCEPVPCPVPRCVPDRPCPEPPPCARRPCRPPVAGAAIVRTASDVRVALADRVLRYEVTEKFVNRGGGLGEADYFFPLPAGAAFQDLKLSINGELVAGEILDAGEARRVYEDIVRRQRDPALVEWAGAGLLRARIFPLPPGEERTVVVRFQSVARREGDALRVDYARGRRQPPGTPGAADNLGSRGSFVLTVPDVASYGAPYSPTHALRVSERRGERRVVVEDAVGDVTVLIPVARAGRGALSLLAHAPGGGDGFALVTVTPPARPARTTPRDVTFVVDVSGSMSGTKLEQAKAAGRQLLGTLSERDRFRIIDFSTDVRTFRDDYVHATRANVAEAERYVESLEAQGSTNISGALVRALDRPDDDPMEEGRLPLVLFVTDGEPTVGERDPDALAKLAARRRGQRRVFTFGLGADVNARLLEQVALEGRGTAHFVRPGESVERALAIVASRLTAPVATDVTVRAEGEDGSRVRLTRVYPTGPVDLFAGQDLVLLARFGGSGAAHVVVEGRGPDGAPVRWATAATFPARERGNAFVARLWATQRVGYLSAERRQHGPSAELDAELRELGERYGIPTELTSYFVREPGMVAQGRGGDVGRRRVGDQPMRLSEAVVTGAPTAAPAPQDRDQRFESAKRAAEQRQAISLADVAADTTSAIGNEATRRVDGRRFTLRDGVWTDARHRAGVRVVRVRAYSEAWFRVAELLPDVRDALALGERVIVAGRAVAIEVAPDGAAKLGAAEEKALVDGW